MKKRGAIVLVRYISDVPDLDLGSINVTGSVVTPWLAKPLASPLFSGMNWSGDTQAPALTIYNMGSDFAPQVDLGSYVADSKIVGLWSVDLARSYFRNCSIEMADLLHLPAAAIVPSEWAGNETAHPTWVANLNSHLKTWPQMLNAFPTALDHCRVCVRPAFQRGGIASGGDRGTGRHTERDRARRKEPSSEAHVALGAETARNEYPAQRQSIEDSDQPGTSIGVCAAARSKADTIDAHRAVNSTLLVAADD